MRALLWHTSSADAEILSPTGLPVGDIAVTPSIDPPRSFLVLHADPYEVPGLPRVKDAFRVVTAMSVPYTTLHGAISALRHQESGLLTFSAMALAKLAAVLRRVSRLRTLELSPFRTTDFGAVNVIDALPTATLKSIDWANPCDDMNSVVRYMLVRDWPVLERVQIGGSRKYPSRELMQAMDERGWRRSCTMLHM
ncbi:hypothetical protein GGF32_007102 [Allomyces javanicus]|nr:hypothetical protein GGF32_007102 [Allomyces javanicus]